MKRENEIDREKGEMKESERREVGLEKKREVIIEGYLFVFSPQF